MVGNKSDLIDEKELEAKKQTLIDLAIQHDIPEPEKRVVLVSAQTGDGIEDLKKLIIKFAPKLKQDIPELEEVTTNPTNIYDNSTAKTKKYILGAVGILGTIGITALIAKTYKYFFDKNKNLKDNTDTVSTNI